MKTNNVRIIAEIANAHQGNPELAVQIAEKAFEAGADGVKFQVFFAEELLVRHHPRFEHFRELAFSPSQWNAILDRFRRQGIGLYCDIFGERALELVSKAGVTGIKIHSSDLGNSHLLKRIQAEFAEVFLSVGGASGPEIRSALEQLRGFHGKPTLLHGFQSYPTALQDNNLCRIPWLIQHFGRWCTVGFQDHSAGDEASSFYIPILAVGMGATVIEKHITLDREAKGIDYFSSLNPSEFAHFVKTMKTIAGGIGSDPETFSQAEKEYRGKVQKHWVLSTPRSPGEIIQPTDLVMKRIHGGRACAAKLGRITGRKLQSHLQLEEPVGHGDVASIHWALIVARNRSTRLPGKALLPFGETKALDHLISRVKQAQSIHKVCLCTTTDILDDEIAAHGEAAKIRVFRGANENVLDRMLGAIEGHNVDVVVRITGDDILVDPEYIDIGINHHLRENVDYTDLKQLPSGTEVEVFSADLLRFLRDTAVAPDGTEYLTWYVTHHGSQFGTTSLPVKESHKRKWRLTLDTPEDYQVILAFEKHARSIGKPLSYRLDDIVAFFEKHPEVLQINSQPPQKFNPPTVCTDLDWMRGFSLT